MEEKPLYRQIKNLEPVVRKPIWLEQVFDESERGDWVDVQGYVLNFLGKERGLQVEQFVSVVTERVEEALNVLVGLDVSPVKKLERLFEALKPEFPIVILEVIMICSDRLLPALESGEITVEVVERVTKRVLEFLVIATNQQNIPHLDLVPSPDVNDDSLMSFLRVFDASY